MNSITDTLGDIWYTYLSGVKTMDVSLAKMVALPCYTFELSSLNKLYRGKLNVSSIIIIIPYLLAVTLSIFSSNKCTYTRLAV